MPAGQEVKMDMKDRLPGVAVAVGNQTETRFRHPPLPGQLRRHLVDVADQLPVLMSDIQTVNDMLSRNDEKMVRRLGGNVLNDNNKIVFINRFDGNSPADNLAKKTVDHGCHLGKTG